MKNCGSDLIRNIFWVTMGTISTTVRCCCLNSIYG